MSDSFIAIFGMGFLLGEVVTLIITAVMSDADNRDSKDD